MNRYSDFRSDLNTRQLAHIQFYWNLIFVSGKCEGTSTVCWRASSLYKTCANNCLENSQEQIFQVFVALASKIQAMASVTLPEPLNLVSCYKNACRTAKTETVTDQTATTS